MPLFPQNLKVTKRQGGATGDATWQTAGNSNTDLAGKNIIIQCGTIAATSDPTVVTFPTAFAFAPVVVAMSVSVVGVNTFVRSSSVTATTVNLTAINDSGSASAAQTVNWIAIGQV